MQRHTTFSFDNLQRLFTATAREPLPDDRPSVIISDFHAGDGSVKDDFRHNADLTIEVMEEYFRRGYRLILNGDVEELQKFRLDAIRRQWPSLYRVIQRFHDGGRCVRIVGNHDADLLLMKDFDMPVYEGLRYRFGDQDDVFIFHGHQASRRYALYNDHLGFLLRYVLGPLPIKNISVSHDNRKRKKLEQRVYSFSNAQKIVSIIGHTHRPLFESLSKTDDVKYNIERLCRSYTGAGSEERLAIRDEIDDLKKHLRHTLASGHHDFGSIYHEDFVVPCMFNSGCVLGKRGITCIELTDSTIALKYWFDKQRSKRYLQYEGYDTVQLNGTSYCETEIKSESLAYVFSRIHLLT